MFALGWVMYTSAESAFRGSRLEQLDGLAEAKKEGLEQVFRGWIDRVNLVARRNLLHATLQAHNEGSDPEAAQRLGSLLSEAVRAVDVIEALAIYNRDGDLVAAAGQDMESGPEEEVSSAFPVAEELFYQGVKGTEDLRVAFVASLSREGEALGDLHIRLNGEAISEVAERDLGLGESGETLVVAVDARGTPRILHRSGIRGTQVWEPVIPEGSTDPVALALEGTEGVFWQDVTDDWGEAVWAGVRYLPEAGWGLVVKVDEEEARASLIAFRDQAFRLTLSLGAFAIVLGVLLAFRFSRPIHDLAEATQRIRDGEFSVRAPVVGEDEVSLLAQTFNQMASELEDRVSLLREYQRYFEVSRDMLCIAGPDGYFKRVNPAFRRCLGWNESQLLSVPFMDFVHPEDLKKTRAEIDRLALGLPTISFENRYRIPQGGYRTLMWTAHPDEATGLIYAIARDVTEQRKAWVQAEEEMKHLRRRLRDAEAEIRRGD